LPRYLFLPFGEGVLVPGNLNTVTAHMPRHGNDFKEAQFNKAISHGADKNM
jgi:hypothetical protein